MTDITDKTKHLPVTELVVLMQQAEDPWRFEDLILWRAGELKDPKALDWVFRNVKGEG